MQSSFAINVTPVRAIDLAQQLKMKRGRLAHCPKLNFTLTSLYLHGLNGLFTYQNADYSEVTSDFIILG